MAVARLLTVVLVTVLLCAVAESNKTVLWPDYSQCGREVRTYGVVIEASHLVQAEKFSSCTVSFSPTNASEENYQWIMRFDRLFIPYYKGDQYHGSPPTIRVHTATSERKDIAHQKSYADWLGKPIATRTLSMDFINIPSDADYRVVIVLDKGGSNCSSGYRCSSLGFYCIDRSLICDGVDHCGNDDDESERLCPRPVQIAMIAVISGGTITVVVIIALAGALFCLCHPKYKVRARGRINRGVTYIRAPKSAPPPPPGTDVVLRVPRRTGPGFQPLPLVLRNSAAGCGTLLTSSPSRLQLASLAVTPTDATGACRLRSDSTRLSPDAALLAVVATNGQPGCNAGQQQPIEIGAAHEHDAAATDRPNAPGASLTSANDEIASEVLAFHCVAAADGQTYSEVHDEPVDNGHVANTSVMPLLA